MTHCHFLTSPLNFERNMRPMSLKILVLMLLCAETAWAGNPAPLFNRPVKLDQSGQPLYNSWERQDMQRHERKKRSGPRDLRRRETSENAQATVAEPDASAAQPGATGAQTTVPATRAAGTSAIQGMPGFAPTARDNAPTTP